MKNLGKMVNKAQIFITLIVIFQFSMAIQLDENLSRMMLKNGIDLKNTDISQFKNAVGKYLMYQMMRSSQRKTIPKTAYKIPQDVLNLGFYGK